jgi:hypothetical protein
MISNSPYIKILTSLILSILLVIWNRWGIPEFISFTLFLYFTYSLIESIGKTIPIRELTAFIYICQILIGAVVTYKFFTLKSFGAMRVSESKYYAYAIPCIMTFILGLYFPLFRYTYFKVRDVFEQKVINKTSFINFGLVILSISFIAEFISKIGINESFIFIFSILYYFRFIGFYYIWLAGWKYRYFVMVVIFIPFLIGSLEGALFIELFIISFLTFVIFQLKRPLSPYLNLFILIFFIFLAFMLQAVKTDFRDKTWGEKGAKMTSIQKISGLFGMASGFNLADAGQRKKANIRFIVRINQGFIVSWIMKKMSDKNEFLAGEYFTREVIGIFLPRFLYADKAVVGDQQKFFRFTGWKLQKKTAMSVSILGDGYGNFGYWGGILFCFLNGVLLNFFLHFTVRSAVKYDASIVLWMPLIFLFSMRCGDEFYIITNHIIKSSLIVFFVFFCAKRIGGSNLFITDKQS